MLKSGIKRSFAAFLAATTVIAAAPIEKIVHPLQAIAAIEQNMVHYAKSGIPCAVSFVTNIDGYEIAPVEVGQSERIKYSYFSLINGNYFLEGWYTDPQFKNIFLSSDAVEHDMVLYAKWNKFINVYFDVQGIGESVEPMRFTKNEKYFFDSLQADGYYFDGWYYDKECTRRYSNYIYDEMMLYAKWIPLVTITFDPNDSGDAFTRQYPVGKRCECDKLYGSNYSFVNWYTDKECTKVFDGIPMEDMTLYAKWEDFVSVHFDVGGRDKNFGIETMKFGKSEYIEIATPKNEDYLFDGWYYDKTCTQKYDGVNTDGMTLYAKWIEKDVIENADFTGAKATVAEDCSIDMSFYAAVKGKNSEAKDVCMRIIRNGRTENISYDENYFDYTGNYRFDYENITPQCMTDNIHAELYIDGELCDTLDYSIEKYLESVYKYTVRMMNNETSDAIKKAENIHSLRMISSMMQLGAEAQKYTGYRADDIVGEDFEWMSEYLYNFDEIPDSDNIFSITGDVSDTNKFVSASLTVDDTVDLQLKIKTDDINRVSFEFEDGINYFRDHDWYYTDIGNGTYLIKIENVIPKVFTPLRVTLGEGKDAPELRYSVAFYLFSMQNNEIFGGIAKAIYEYAYAFADYDL